MTTTKPVAGYIASRRYAFLVGTDRVVIDHRIMGGVPCIAGTRIPVATIVGLIAEGLTADGVIAEHPQLTDEDVRAALEFAAAAVDERHIPLRTPA
jgi:uncharacterized protein (DUF433 family)